MKLSLRKAVAGAVAVGVFTALTGVAFADNVQNNVETSDGTVTIISGDAGAAVEYRIAKTNGDDQNGCNASASSPATLNISLPAGVNASDSTPTLTDCKDGDDTNGVSVTFTSSTPGIHSITVPSVTDDSAGTYNTASATFSLRVLPRAPSGLVATGGDAQVSLDWVGSADDTGSPSKITGYRIYQTDPAGVSAPVATTAAGTTAKTITGLTNDTQYCYRVAAYKTITATTSIESALSNQGCDVPAAPILLGDTTVPVITAFSINDAAAWTNNRDVTIDLTATDAGGFGSYILNNDSAVPATTTTGDTIFNGTETDRSHQLSDSDGTKTVHVKVFDTAGNSAVSSDTIGLDRANPTFGNCPAGGPFILNSGSQAVGPITATDVLSGINTGSSTLSGSVNTSTVGEKSVTFTAVDNAGNSLNKECKYIVAYNFIGFSSPVDNPGWVNKMKAGQAVPLKWRLTDANGSPVLALSTATITVAGQTCANLGSSIDLIEEVSPGGSGLQNLGDGYYQLNWKTPTSYANSCKKMMLNLGEGLTHDALFYFTK